MQGSLWRVWMTSDSYQLMVSLQEVLWRTQILWLMVLLTYWKIQGHRKENILGWATLHGGKWDLSISSLVSLSPVLFLLSPSFTPSPSHPGLPPAIYFCCRPGHLLLRSPPLCDFHSLPSMAFKDPMIRPWLQSLIFLWYRPQIWCLNSSYMPRCFAPPSFASCVALMMLNCSVPHTVHL